MAKKANTTELEQPTADLLQQYAKRFDEDMRYGIADQAIAKLFKQLPYNQELKDVLLKVSVINQLYNTNIYATVAMAKHVHELKIDSDLESHSLEVVNRIAEVAISGKKYQFFSFATKYCSWHDQGNYPIFDSFVEKLIVGYRDQYKFEKFKTSDLRKYSRFKEVIESFQRHFGLLDFGFKKIDKFLFMYGRKRFGSEQRIVPSDF